MIRFLNSLLDQESNYISCEPSARSRMKRNLEKCRMKGCLTPLVRQLLSLSGKYVASYLIYPITSYTNKL